MDGNNFDDLARKLATGTSRRNVLRGLIGGGAALVGMKASGTLATVGCTQDQDCDDHNACTIDKCEATGICSHTPVDCDDHNACTVDMCDPDTGCVHTPIDCSHLDGECTAGHCNTSTGECYAVKTNEGEPCSTGICTNGVCGCVGDPKNARDRTPCSSNAQCCSGCCHPTRNFCLPENSRSCKG